MDERVAVTIEFSSEKQHPEEPSESTSLKVNGELLEKGSCHFLSYVEEDSELGQQTHILKLMDNQDVLIMRKGATSMRLPLSLGQETVGQYESPFGPFVMQAILKDYRFNWDGQLGRVVIVYELHLQNAYAGKFRLEYHLKAS